MKLIKIEHKDKGIYYFTNINKASVYTKVQPSQIKKTGKGKGWTFEEVEDDNILPQYINPGGKSSIDEMEELLKQLKIVIKKLKEENGK